MHRPTKAELKRALALGGRGKGGSIQVLGDPTPSFPEDFNRRLQQFDKDLVVAWHHPPTWPRTRAGVWKIEQCVEHHGGFRSNGYPEHTHACRRIYVLMIQDEEGRPLPLGEHVFEKLGAMRAHVESYGGATARGLRNFIAHSNALDEEREKKRQAAIADMNAHNQRFNRLTINRLWNLVEQHDLRPNR
ncbi:MAG TPA: hypothetical protein VKU44_05880 [Terriglobia bacterium]|nr:hypothetical protein [Terriglobia bacterium]